ncbi:MAG: polysaccharide biosynthesis tyrosine autokinase [Methylacidiphilales bacterium]|nr:polysaccharide biosynthesis tyrosine autokinase [Candidatus Methylacidiphilales bacterium]
MKNASVPGPAGHGAAAPADLGPLFNISYLYALLMRRLWLITLCYVSAVLLAIGYITIATPLYESTSVLQVEQEQQHVYTSNDNRDNPEQDDLKGQDVLKTMEDDLQLDSLFESVVTDPAIASDPGFLAGIGITDKDTPVPVIARKLKHLTTINLRHGTRLIDVSVDYPTAPMAQKLNQTLINYFIASNGQAQTGTQKTATQFLLGQASQIKDGLQKSEDAVNIYKQALMIRDQITDQQKVIDDLTQRYREKHPKLIQARALMDSLHHSFDNEIQKVMAAAPSEASYWAADAGHMTGTNGSFDDRVEAELKFVEARTSVLQREVDTESALFDNVLTQMREANVSKEAPPILVDIKQPPELPILPSKPNKIIVLLLGSLGGIIFGVGMIFLLNSLDSSLKTVEETEQLIGLPVLVALPATKMDKSTRKPKGQTISSRLVTVSDPGGVAAENFRSLRASLNLLGKAEERRTILFTSALAGEGKTFTSCNHAVSLAQVGLKTLLIDADLRLPSVHSYFNLPNDKPGLTEFVSMGLEMRETVHSNLVENLDVMLSGVKNPNPAEFLSGRGFADTIKEALHKYDRIVVDSPPVAVVGDTLLMVSHIQSVCLVVRSGKTPRGAVQRAIYLLDMAEVTPVGIVLNQLSPHWSGSSSAYGTYHYSYHKYGKSYV